MMMRFVLALTVGVLLGGVVCGQTAGQLLMQRKKVSGSGFENLFVTPENGKALGWSGGTLGMLDVVAAGSAPSFSEVTITGGGIRSQSGSLAYKFYDVVDSVAVPYIQVRLYDDQDPPVLIGSSLMGFRADGGGGGKQIFQGSSDSFQFEGIGGANTASVFAANFIGGGAGLVNVPLNALTGLGSGVGTWMGTPSSANLRAALSDEVGTGAAYFVGGALGTPASVTLTNGTGLPLTTGVTGVLPLANGGTGLTSSGTAGHVLTSTGTGFVMAAPSGGGSGTVTSVTGTGTVNGLTLTGTVTSSGSLTLGGTLAGTASLNINGTVGATTPTTGAFTTLSASGTITIPSGTPSVQSVRGPTVGLYDSGASAMGFCVGNTLTMYYNATSLVLNGAGVSFSFNNDTFLNREAANAVSQRNSTNAQAFLLERTFTSATNRETLAMGWRASPSLFLIQPVAGSGGGTAQDVGLARGGSITTGAVITDGTAQVYTTARGGIAGREAIRTVATNTTATTTDRTLLVDAAAGSVTITLPAVSGLAGFRLNVKVLTTNAGANTVTVDPNASETVDGSSASLTSTTAYTSWQLHCDGAAWYLIK